MLRRRKPSGSARIRLRWRSSAPRQAAVSPDNLDPAGNGAGRGLRDCPVALRRSGTVCRASNIPSTCSGRQIALPPILGADVCPGHALCSGMTAGNPSKPPRGTDRRPALVPCTFVAGGRLANPRLRGCRKLAWRFDAELGNTGRSSVSAPFLRRPSWDSKRTPYLAVLGCRTAAARRSTAKFPERATHRPYYVRS